MAMTKMVNGVKRDLTPEEEARQLYVSPETLARENLENKEREMPSIEEKIDVIMEYLNVKKQAGDVLPATVTTLLDNIDAVNIKYPTSE